MTTPSLEHWLATSLRMRADLPAAGCKTLALLTVVIPCYGRQDFLLRQCVYWHGSGARVVIVDGSSEPLGENIQKIVSALEDITYLYANASMMDRLQLASGQIQTPYAILLGDDEFLLFDGLRSAINQLEQDQSLVACIAQSLAFYPSRDGAHCTYGDGYPHWRYSVKYDDVQQRLNAAMSDYTAATCYAVLRTPVWRKSWGQLKNWSSPYVGEMQQGITTYIWGKLTTVDEVYWMRSSENRPVTNRGFNRGLSFQEWWTSPRFSAEHELFVSILKSEFAEAAPDQAGKAESVVVEAVETFLQHLEELNKSQRATSQGRIPAVGVLRLACVRVFKKLLPQQWIEQLKSAWFGSGKTAAQGNLGDVVELWQHPGERCFLITGDLKSELSAMERLIAGFYQARTGRLT